MSNKHPCQNQQDSVDGHDDDRKSDVDACRLEDIIQHDRQTGYGTDNQFARHQKVVYCRGCHKHTEGHNYKFFPKLARFHYAKRIKYFTHSLD